MSNTYNIIDNLTKNNYKLIKIILVILIIIVGIYKLRNYHKKNNISLTKDKYKENNIFLTTDKYKQFKILEYNWNIIKDEIPDFDINKDMLYRPRETAYGESLDIFIENFKDKAEWTQAWTKNAVWYHFPIIYKNKCVGNVEEICPDTCNLLKSFNNIRVSGFALLLPNGKVDIHHDEVGPTFNSMALNMLLTGKKSSLYIKPNNHDKFLKYTHTNGKAVIFNSEQEHYADNQDNSHRVILYIDFSTD